MKRSKFTESQIVFILRQGEEGTPVCEVCRKAGISETTYHNWRKKYGGLMPRPLDKLRATSPQGALSLPLVGGCQVGLRMGVASGYKYVGGARHNHAHAYLLPAVTRLVEQRHPTRVFDLGCGNGDTAAHLASLGYEVVGIDPSVEGVALAREYYPSIRFEIGSGYDDLAATFGTFPLVVCLEVIEHIYSPRQFAKSLFDLVEPGGAAIVSTPYHGYWKNLALAVAGKLDAHHSPLWDHGHIKFWSIPTLGQLLREAGFSSISFDRVGRIRPFAKSMIAICVRN